MSAAPPKSVIRDGNLKATIWENQGEKGTYFTTTLAKTYRDQNGELRDTNVFTGNDLLRVSELAREARTKTRELRQGLSPSHVTEQTPARTQERGAADSAPNQLEDDRQARAQAFLQDAREERGAEHEYELER